MSDNLDEPWDWDEFYTPKSERPGGTIYRAGYEEKGPQDFVPMSGHQYDPDFSTDLGGCWVCVKARKEYESWRLKQIRSQDESPVVTYPQAVKIIRNIINSLPEAFTRGFSYEGEWRDREWLEKVLEVVLKGDPK